MEHRSEFKKNKLEDEENKSRGRDQNFFINNSISTSLYGILGVESSATQEEITKNFRKLSKIHHPDKGGNEEFMKKLNIAYKTLTNPILRENYDINRPEGEEDGQNLDLPTLGRGFTISDTLKKQVLEWKSLFNTIPFFEDNIKASEAEYKEILEQKENFEKKNFDKKKKTQECSECEVCHTVEELKEYHDQFKSAFNFDQLFEKLFLQEVWKWKPVSFSSLKERVQWLEGSINSVKEWSKISENSQSEKNPWFAEIYLDQEIKSKVEKICEVIRNHKPTESIDLKEISKNIQKARDSNAFVFEKGVLHLQQKNQANDFRIKTGMYIHPLAPKDLPEFPVLDPPIFKSNNPQNCLFCGSSFGMLRWRHNCRSCGDIFCSNCLVPRQIPKFGYLSTVQVCITCSKGDLLIDPQLWVDMALKALKSNNISAARRLLLLVVKSDGVVPKIIENLKDASRNLWEEKLFSSAIAIMEAVNPDASELHDLLLRCCQDQLFSPLLYLFDIATSKMNSTELIKFGNKFLENEKMNLNAKGLLALVSYWKAHAGATDYLKKFHEFEKKEPEIAQMFLCFAVKSLSKNEIVKLGHSFLTSGNVSLARFCFEAVFQKNEWKEIINKLFSEKKLSELASLINYLLTKNILKKEDHELCSITESSNSRLLDLTIKFADRGQKDIACFYASRILRKNDFTIEKIENLLDEGNLEKIIIGIKILGLKKSFSIQEWIRIANQLFSSNKALGFQFLDFCNEGFLKIGEIYFIQENYPIALDCFLLGKCNSELLSAKGKIIQAKNDQKWSSLYYLQAFNASKRSQEIFSHICELFWNNSGLRDCIISFIKSIKAEKKTSKFHFLLASIYSQGKSLNDLVIGALHYSPSSESRALKSKVNEEIRKQKKAQAELKLTTAIYSMSLPNLASMLINMDDATYEVCKEYNKKQSMRNINEVAAIYRSMLYLINAGIEIRDHNWQQAKLEIEKAFKAYPTQDMAEGISTLYLNEEFTLSNYYALKLLLAKVIDKGVLMAKVDERRESTLQKLFQIDKSILFIPKCETAIAKSSTELEAGYAYMDFFMALRDPSASINCLLWAISCFLKVQAETNDSSDSFAYKSLIFTLASQAATMAEDYLNPCLKLEILKQCIAYKITTSRLFIKTLPSTKLTKAKCQTKIISLAEQSSTKKLIHFILNSAKAAPILSFLPVSCLDIMFLNAASGKLEEKYLEELDSKGESSLCPRYLAQYYMLEGTWKGWFRSPFEEKRNQSMNSLLDLKGITMKQVESYFKPAIILRDPDGWMHELPKALKLAKEYYTKVEGVKFDLETGKVNFLFVTNENKPPLFDAADLEEILRRGIKSTIFTLDQPTEFLKYHPFQEMKYFPEELKQTRFLETLLHTDYLLKMLSMGVEVNTKPPFKMRDATQGFMKRLPKDIRDEFQRIATLKVNRGGNVAHRFWIEAGELGVYQETENKTTLAFYFSDVKMVVKKHLLVMDENGNLVDSEEDSDSSPEAEFARFFSERYEEIGLYFSELIRLRELYKLAHICDILSSYYKHLKIQIDSIKKDESRVRTAMTELRKQVKKYPINTEFELSEAYNETLRMNGVSDYQVSYDQKSKLKSQLREKLRQADESILSQVTNMISDQFKLPKYSIQSSVDSWLRYSSDNLIDILATKVCELQKQELRPLYDTLGCIGIKSSETDLIRFPKNEIPYWIPAAFMQCDEDESSKSKTYGGVNMILKRVAAHLNSFDNLQRGKHYLEKAGERGEKLVVHYYGGSDNSKILTVRFARREEQSTQVLWDFEKKHATLDHISFHKAAKIKGVQNPRCFNVHSVSGRSKKIFFKE